MLLLIIVGDVDMLIVHSKIPNGVIANYDVGELAYSNTVFMCIKDKLCNEFQIPDNLEHLVENILSDIYQLSPNLYHDSLDKYCYLTVKKGYVQPNTTGNREGFHIDGFKSDQENFIWSDCEETPTEVAVGNFLLSDDHEKSLVEMEKQASKWFKYQLNIKTLYCMDQKCVHRPTINKTDKTILRTFIKITFSKELFNCFGNAWNYKIPHIKPTTCRKETRNHSVL